jgi:hypothetical protein
MNAGEKFSFLISADIAGRMDRVVVFNDGRVVAKQPCGDDVVYTVEKT